MLFQTEHSVLETEYVCPHVQMWWDNNSAGYIRKSSQETAIANAWKDINYKNLRPNIKINYV